MDKPQQMSNFSEKAVSRKSEYSHNLYHTYLKDFICSLLD